MASFDYRNNCLTTLYNIYGDKIDCNAGGQDQETPLMIATADNNIAFITTLYNTYGDKVDPNLVDKDGFTALEMALNRDYFDSAKKILQLFGHKISTNLDKIFFNAVSDCNYDLLYLVNKYCHDNIDWNSDFLLENNIILKAVQQNDAQKLLTLLHRFWGDKFDTSINICNYNGDNALMYLVKNNNLPLIKTLYEYWGNIIDINACNRHGNTVLMYLVKDNIFLNTLLTKIKKYLASVDYRRIKYSVTSIYSNNSNMNTILNECKADICGGNTTIVRLAQRITSLDENLEECYWDNWFFDTLLKSVAGNNILLIKTINEYWSNNPDVDKDCNCSTELISIAQSNIYLVEDIYKEEDGKQNGNSIFMSLVEDNIHLIDKIYKYWGNKLDLGVRNCDGDTVLIYLAKHNNIYLIKKLHKYCGDQLFEQSKNALNMATNCECLEVLLDYLLHY